jgi:hypothetical protein
MKNRRLPAGILFLALPALAWADITNIAQVSYRDASNSAYTLMSNEVVIGVSPSGGSPINSNEARKVLVYPNPWRGDRATERLVNFLNLPPGGSVKLFTISGHLMRTLQASSGSAPWNLLDESGSQAASGLYIYLVSDSEGQKITSGKIAIMH